MNIMRTAMLLAAMTALFMGVGYLIGGQTGMLIAFGVAALTNFFSYWNSDKLALRAYNAQEVDAQSFPNFYNMVAHLAQNAHHVDNVMRPAPNSRNGCLAMFLWRSSACLWRMTVDAQVRP